MLIGADCSVATEPVAELAPNWNLVQVSLVVLVSYRASCMRIADLAAWGL